MDEYKSEFKVIPTEQQNNLPTVLPYQIVKAPQPAITAPTGGGTVDTEARTAINSIITTLEKLGLVKLN